MFFGSPPAATTRPPPPPLKLAYAKQVGYCSFCNASEPAILGQRNADFALWACRRISGLGMQALAHLQHPAVSSKPKPPDPFAHLQPQPAARAPSSPPSSCDPDAELPHKSLGTLASFPGDPFASPGRAAANNAPDTEASDTLMDQSQELGTSGPVQPMLGAGSPTPSNFEGPAAAAAAGQPTSKSRRPADAIASGAQISNNMVNSRQCCRPSASVLQDILYWLASYVDLWRRPCSATGLLLAADYGSCQPVPPYVRPFWLTSKELRDAALDAAQRQTFHSHAVPPKCYAARGL